jgi:probable rRNA maturation factor
MTNNTPPLLEITAHMMTAEVVIDDAQWQSVVGLSDILKKSMHGVNNIFDDADFCPTSVTFTLTNDNEIQKLNKNFREMDKATNVLSFPDGDMDEAGRMHIGDIAMAFETMEREAKSADISMSDHIAHLTIHGLLHLYGYDHIDDDDAIEMESIEIEILEDMGIKNPYTT